ncbi:chromosome condensation and segregation factor B [Spiroplasma sabaudiense Ar-1343]|uniref:Segregation and condensation protein B n=1 Tax=Spiroplasma sabaudiense Ar-1343 TaxID=1276257 RepID=W6A9E4_9MOLU|nr:SMC-Scp complex subunit ScpB [Spiroplasma sabaudiense]AHI53647.1 chromosome condensation and segregation factor B [Spiroplasma sabaudiense Ar-1343]
MTNEKIMGIIESILFVNGDEGISEDYIHLILENQSAAKIAQALQGLREKYRNDLSCGLDIQKFAGNRYRMVTKKDNHDYLSKMTNIKTESKLSSASIETLSIIAYKGPISRPEIEQIRGVGCDAIMYKLKIRNLIKEMGKSELPGRPMLYGITNDFLKLFNLNSLEELPELPGANLEDDADIFSREQ